MSNTRVSAIIVNYNSNQHLNKLLASMILIDEYIKEVIIVDNNSKNFEIIIPSKLSNKIIKIANKTNLGFSKAVNQGIKISKSKYILLINPDAYFIDTSIKLLIQKITADKTIGSIGGTILKDDTKTNIQEYFSNDFEVGVNLAVFEFTILKRLLPKNKISKKFHVVSKNTKEVTSLCGAYLIFRKKINKINLLLDEDYFLYLEDVEFGLLVKKLGYKNIYYPNSIVRHVGGGSTNNKKKILLKYWYNSRDIFFKKHLSKYNYFLVHIIFEIEKTLLKLISHD